MTAALFGAGCESHSNQVRRFQSPSGQSQLVVLGADAWPTRFWVSRKVQGWLLRPGAPTLNAVLYAGDGFDAAFDSTYGWSIVRGGADTQLE